jgi:hypothetical protein
MRLGELRNAICRRLIVPPAHATVPRARVEGDMKLTLGTDFEVRRVGVGLGLFALKNIGSTRAVSRLHEVVRRTCEFDRIKQYRGPPRPDWNTGQALVVVPGADDLAIDSHAHNLAICAAAATQDRARLQQLDSMGVASACRRGVAPNAQLLWTEYGDCFLIIGFRPGWAPVVMAGEEIVQPVARDAMPALHTYA